MFSMPYAQASVGQTVEVHLLWQQFDIIIIPSGVLVFIYEMSRKHECQVSF